MKTKKVLFGISTMLLLFTMLSSCQESNMNASEEESNTLSINEKSFNPDFDWSMTQNIAIEVNSAEKSIVNITSVDNNIRYHKGVHLGGNKTYIINLCIPAYIKQLNLNNHTFDLNSNKITLNLAN